MKILVVTDAWDPQVNGVDRTPKSTRRLKIAAYPVTGPIDVIGHVTGTTAAGALGDDLRSAALRALTIDRGVAHAHAERFSWEACTRQFLAHLCPVARRTSAALRCSSR